MLMMPLSVPSRPEKGPTDADDALAGAHAQEAGQLMLTMLALPGSHAQEGGQLMLMMPLSVPSRPEKGPTDADDALVGACLTPSKGTN